MNKPKESHETFLLELTRAELLHVRDLFSVKLPPEMASSVSQVLAESQGRSLVESSLWNKLTKQFVAARVPTGDSAPDFVVAVAGTPTIGVFQVDHSADGEEATGDGVFAFVEQLAKSHGAAQEPPPEPKVVVNPEPSESPDAVTCDPQPLPKKRSSAGRRKK